MHKVYLERKDRNNLNFFIISGTKKLKKKLGDRPYVGWSKEEQEEQRSLYLSGQHKTLENLPWGTIGPNAITYFAKLLELEKFAQPQEVFYPVHWRDALNLFEPNFPHADFITEKTFTVHLWNECIKWLKPYPPPKGSFIYDICQQHNIKTPSYLSASLDRFSNKLKQKLKQVRKRLTK
ncbi:MAG: hypothetical protein GDA44_01020 [Prochloron sp. SP5CPC1]|nr:hypothetical protein [Candidatus Paraprochloron terpiosi SP5CPC1]